MNNLIETKSGELAREMLNSRNANKVIVKINRLKQQLSEIEFTHLTKTIFSKWLVLMKELIKNNSISLSQKEETILYDLFNDISDETVSEMYEVAKCFNLKLNSGVYFLRNLETGLLKIGCSTNIPNRMRQIKQSFKHVGYPCNLKLEAIHLCFKRHINIAEGFFHEEFNDNRKIGEWFDITNNQLKESFLSVSSLNYTANDVFVSFDDFESLNFKTIKKHYYVSPLKYEEKLTHGEDFYDLKHSLTKDKFFGFLDVENELSFIVNTTHKNKIKISAIDYWDKPISEKTVGFNGDVEKFNFMKLKEVKLDSSEVDKIILKSNKNLKEIAIKNNVSM